MNRAPDIQTTTAAGASESERQLGAVNGWASHVEITPGVLNGNGVGGGVGGVLRALDLFCCAGGASKGLADAGFEVTGVDIVRRKNYPFRFIEGDALKADTRGYDLIWASPPCQAYTQASASQRNAGKVYPDLMAVTRAKLEASGVPFIIENTPGAPMRVDVVLCGSMFGLRLIRHRWFECSFPIFRLFQSCVHHPNPVVATGHGTPTWSRAKNGGKCYKIGEVRDAMGIHWMNRDELSQAIPPAYSHWLAMQFLAGRAAGVGVGRYAPTTEAKPND